MHGGNFLVWLLIFNSSALHAWLFLQILENYLRASSYTIFVELRVGIFRFFDIYNEACVYKYTNKHRELKNIIDNLFLASCISPSQELWIY